jgi:hypothetical protein
VSNLEALARNLEVIAENTSKVYNAGLEKGKAQGGSAPLWTKGAYNIRFNSDEWADEETEIYIPTLSSLAELFYNVQFTKIKKLTIKSDTPITFASNAFFSPWGGTAFLETLVLDCDFSQCTKFDNWLMRQNKLKRIEGQPFNFSGVTGFSGFSNYANKVEYFRVVPNTIKVSFDIKHWSKLDDETIQSVIDGLADLTGGTAQTLTLHADVKAKLTEAQLATITGKNWTVA